MKLFLTAVFAILLSTTCPAQTYTVKNENGIWWLEHPTLGRLWSFGVDVVELGSPGTPDNPSYEAHKLFPTDEAWILDTLGKFNSWGINSIGAWSEHGLFSSLDEIPRGDMYCA